MKQNEDLTLIDNWSKTMLHIGRNCEKSIFLMVCEVHLYQFIMVYGVSE